MSRLLAILVVALCFISTSAFSQIVLTRNSSYAIVYDNVDDIGVLVFHGEMDLGSSYNINRFLEYTSADILVIHSAGGYMVEGYGLGAVLRDAGVRVLIPEGSICLSACAFAAMSADDLIVLGVLGFHTPYINRDLVGDLSEIEIAVIEAESRIQLMLYMSITGYPLTFLEEIVDNTSQSVYMVFETAEDLYAFRSEDAVVNYNIMSTEDIARYLQSYN